MAVVLYSFKFLGSEFLPELNEGALWVETKLPMSMSSLTETTQQDGGQLPPHPALVSGGQRRC